VARHRHTTRRGGSSSRACARPRVAMFTSSNAPGAEQEASGELEVKIHCGSSAAGSEVQHGLYVPRRVKTRALSARLRAHARLLRNMVTRPSASRMALMLVRRSKPRQRPRRTRVTRRDNRGRERRRCGIIDPKRHVRACAPVRRNAQPQKKILSVSAARLRCAQSRHVLAVSKRKRGIC